MYLTTHDDVFSGSRARRWHVVSCSWLEANACLGACFQAKEGHTTDRAPPWRTCTAVRSAAIMQPSCVRRSQGSAHAPCAHAPCAYAWVWVYERDSESPPEARHASARREAGRSCCVCVPVPQSSSRARASARPIEGMDVKASAPRAALIALVDWSAASLVPKPA